MGRRFIKAVLIAAFVVILPAIGNPAILRAAHLWILLATGVLASLLQPDYQPFGIAAKPQDRGTGAQIIWSVYIVQVVAIGEATYFRYPRSVDWDAIALAALAVMGAGLALRTWAVMTLGPLFTMHIAIGSQHRLVREGPFRVVRHPSYLGALLLYTAATIFLHAWVALVAALLLLPLAFARRIHYEEQLLLAAFGPDYEHYRQQVQTLLPGLW